MERRFPPIDCILVFAGYGVFLTIGGAGLAGLLGDDVGRDLYHTGHFFHFVLGLVLLVTAALLAARKPLALKFYLRGLFAAAVVAALENANPWSTVKLLLLPLLLLLYIRSQRVKSWLEGDADRRLTSDAP